jgi:hypothetical protein
MTNTMVTPKHISIATQDSLQVGCAVRAHYYAGAAQAKHDGDNFPRGVDALLIHRSHPVPNSI